MPRDILTRGLTPRRAALIAAVALGGAVGLATLGAGLAPSQNQARAQVWTGANSGDDINYRLSVIDAELADIRARIGAKAPGGKTKSAGGGGSNADLMLRLDRLEAQIRKLTGQIEQIQYQQKSIADDATRRFNDIEFRLTQLEGGDVSKLKPVPTLGGEAAAAASTKSSAPEVSISERSDLDRAIEDVKQGRFDIAVDRLRTFVTNYPGSPLTGEALYWMGESQFIRGAYQNAARSYLDGYNSDRKSDMAPKNLERLGVTLGKLGQINEACLTLREVRKQFPSAPPELLNKADSEQSKLNCG